MIRNTGKLHTDRIVVDESGYYQLTGTLEFTVDTFMQKALQHMNAKLMVLKPGFTVAKAKTTMFIETEFSDDVDWTHNVTGAVSYNVRVNLEKGDQAYIKFDQIGNTCVANLTNFKTYLEPTFLWGDGYDFIANHFNTVEVGTGLTGGGDLTANTNEITINDLYHEGMCLASTDKVNNEHLVKLFNSDNVEIVRINCETGEINLNPEVKQPYREMWMTLQNTFPQLFINVNQREEYDITSVEAEPHKLQVQWELENTKDIANLNNPNNAYDRAMEMLKNV